MGVEVVDTALTRIEADALDVLARLEASIARAERDGRHGTAAALHACHRRLTQALFGD